MRRKSKFGPSVGKVSRGNSGGSGETTGAGEGTGGGVTDGGILGVGAGAGGTGVAVVPLNHEKMPPQNVVFDAGMKLSLIGYS
jgi:hypothetical protein